MAKSKTERVLRGWGTPDGTITMPFSPATDGIVLGAFAPQTSANSYVFIYDNGANYMRAMSSGGTGYGMTFPAVKGHTYAEHLIGNVQTKKYTFIPFR